MGRFSDRLSHPLPGLRKKLRLAGQLAHVAKFGSRKDGHLIPRAGAEPLEGDGIQWVGHATAVIRTGGLTILTDPVWSTRLGPIRRATPPAIDLHGLDVDVVLISHDHRDHLDAATAKRLRDATWLVPVGLGEWCNKRGITAHEHDWGDTHRIDGVAFTFVPAHHWSRRGLFDTCDTLWGGWVIDGGFKAYFAGDTGAGPRVDAILDEHGPFDAMLLPIGGCEPRWFMKDKHTNPEDVAAIAAATTGDVLPVHWGTFHISAEHLVEPIERLRSAWQQAGLAHDRLVDGGLGTTWRP